MMTCPESTPRTSLPITKVPITSAFLSNSLLTSRSSTSFKLLDLTFLCRLLFTEAQAKFNHQGTLPLNQPLCPLISGAVCLHNPLLPRLTKTNCNTRLTRKNAARLFLPPIFAPTRPTRWMVTLSLCHLRCGWKILRHPLQSASPSLTRRNLISQVSMQELAPTSSRLWHVNPDQPPWDLV